VTLELVPDRRVAFRFYILVTCLTQFGVMSLVFLFAGIASRSFLELMMHVVAYGVSMQIAVTGVFIDFYRKESPVHWTVDDGGVHIFKPGEEERFVSWDNVSWINPREHRVSMAIHDQTNPEAVFFVLLAERKEIYRIYLQRKVYPFLSDEEIEKTKTEGIEPRGVLAHDPGEEKWDPRRRQ
jgi:hypothetical protein